MTSQSDAYQEVLDIELRHQADWNARVYSVDEAATLAARHCDQTRGLAYKLARELDALRAAPPTTKPSREALTNEAMAINALGDQCPPEAAWIRQQLRARACAILALRDSLPNDTGRIPADGGSTKPETAKDHPFNSDKMLKELYDNVPEARVFAELGRAWSKTNLGDHGSVQIFLMCFDALWPQIVALRAAPPTTKPTDADPQGTKRLFLGPTPEMIEAGAQRLVRVETGEEKWPDAWSKMDVRAARNDAEKCWLSMWLAAPSFVNDTGRIPADGGSTKPETAKDHPFNSDKMLKELYDNVPEARAWMDDAADAIDFKATTESQCRPYRTK